MFRNFNLKYNFNHIFFRYKIHLCYFTSLIIIGDFHKLIYHPNKKTETKIIFFWKVKIFQQIKITNGIALFKIHHIYDFCTYLAKGCIIIYFLLLSMK